MSKATPLSVQNDLNAALFGFKEQASAVKAAHESARQDILRNDRLSDSAKISDLAKLDDATRSKLESIKQNQRSYVTGLRSQLEKELRGNQPSDANSVLLRRDATERARKITDNREAMEVLQDAIANGDAEMAHAIGTRARNNAWLEASEAWRAAYPTTAGSAEALSYVEEMTSGPAYNVANSATYSAPLD